MATLPVLYLVFPNTVVSYAVLSNIVRRKLSSSYYINTAKLNLHLNRNENAIRNILNYS